MNRDSPLETKRLVIRHWTLSESDREFFHHIHSDPVVRQFYPERLSRKLSDERLEWLVDQTSETDINWRVACLKETGEQLGFTGLSQVPYETSFTPAVEIGWMYEKSNWGNGYATEAAIEVLRHGFEYLGLPEIVAFAVHNNHASTAVMDRIGLIRDSTGDFDHPRVPDSHSHLKRHVLYRLTKEQWNVL